MTLVGTMNDNQDAIPPGMAEDGSAVDREAYAWVMRFASGQAEEADIAALKRWSQRDPAHAAAFRRISRTWKNLGDVKRNPAAAIAEAARPVPLRSIGRRAFLGGAIAASAAGVAVLAARPPLDLWPSVAELAADYRTATGEQRRVVLVDSTAIEMNTQTSIALRPAGAGGIDLIAGEATFAAAERAAGDLVVHAAEGRIVAHNARFNVRHQPAGICVTCLEGEVRVEQGGAVLPLSASRQAVYSARGMSTAVAVETSQVTAWLDGVVIFRMTPVSEAIAEVNRYRSGRIILTNQELGRRLFSARLRIANIGQAVVRIEQVFGARATSLPGGIVLLG